MGLVLHHAASVTSVTSVTDDLFVSPCAQLSGLTSRMPLGIMDLEPTLVLPSFAHDDPHDCLVHRQLYETSNGVLETFYTKIGSVESVSYSLAGLVSCSSQRRILLHRREPYPLAWDSGARRLHVATVQFERRGRRSWEASQSQAFTLVAEMILQEFRSRVQHRICSNVRAIRYRS